MNNFDPIYIQFKNKPCSNQSSKITLDCN